MTEWHPIETGFDSDLPHKLRFRDSIGEYEAPGPFYISDGHWYHVTGLAVRGKPIARAVISIPPDSTREEG